ncbi:helix-turn-helix transcriptional regulator [Aggregicoccus sp. 17bor-14]|uniref:winged helix-turn-helix transcriptional regulator n=1 Tax=Myxococcaceae TaxID=31 RepID=UPI00129CAFE3|nr:MULTISPECIES: helix-turn-helix domain-containing protein [Myxococcaceae]MBF5041141.1 helix-turn-helix transcriptional regulator [Simulacricoccus sp. 17bor-14]MRI86928.1 helix-turn-helix transcriptional regulator [Aggregicoccus sp. 17bor-14]
MQRHCQHLCERFQLAMELLARPWNGLIVATLEEGPLRFGELAERVEGIGDRMLSSRLKELEAGGVLVREVEPGPPVRVRYRLTPAGEGFRAVLDSISRWGEQLEQGRRSAGGASARAPRRARAAAGARAARQP